MKKLQELKKNYSNIASQNIPAPIKTLLLESILHQLATLSYLPKQGCIELSINSCIKTQKTLSTLLSPSVLSNTYVNQRGTASESSVLARNLIKEELELKIIEKQRLKCLLNDDIETLEQQYFERQKILITKKDFCEELDGQIARKSYEITKKSCQKSQKTAKQQEKQSLSARLKHFFLG